MTPIRSAFVAALVTTIVVAPGCGSSDEQWNRPGTVKLGEACSFHEDCADKSDLVACLGGWPELPPSRTG
jgi:hypothetical protein